MYDYTVVHVTVLYTMMVTVTCVSSYIQVIFRDSGYTSVYHHHVISAASSVICCHEWILSTK